MILSGNFQVEPNKRIQTVPVPKIENLNKIICLNISVNIEDKAFYFEKNKKKNNICQFLCFISDLIHNVFTIQEELLCF